MKLEDFTQQEQKQIKKGLTFSVISDKETAERILSLVPEELMKKIPFFVRKHANTRTVKRISIEYPELYAVAPKEGEWSEMSGYEDEGNKLNITEEYISKCSSLIVGKNIGDAFTGMMSGLGSVLRWDDER